jgi:hypothetical protein
MFRLALPSALLLAVLVQAAGCGASLAAAIQDPNMVVLPDPDPARAVHFPASTATAGVAHIGPALDRARIGTHDCSALNPCALATPALSDAAVTVPRPPERVGARRRARQPG